MIHKKKTIVAHTKTAEQLSKISKLSVGWQEWCAFPQLHIPAIKVKIDSGAKTSALHAWDVKPIQRQGEQYVHFIVHPLQRNMLLTRECCERLIDYRLITSSNGQQELRYVIATEITLGSRSWEIEVSLTNRDNMAFRMILGRDALKGQAIIDPAKILRQGRLSKREVRLLYQSHEGKK
jgi:ribosomal protein S6--L-glutamate ligase